MEEIRISGQVSAANFEDIDTTQDQWAKHWPSLLSQPALVSLEKEARARTNIRQMIAGPSRPLNKYTITPKVFLKLVSQHELPSIQKFHSTAGKYASVLVEYKQGEGNCTWVSTENLIPSMNPPKVLANLQLFQTNFDPDVLQEEEEYLTMGSGSYFELSWSVKEIITTNPVTFL